MLDVVVNTLFIIYDKLLVTITLSFVKERMKLVKPSQKTQKQVKGE